MLASRPAADPIYRLNIALANSEHTKLAMHLRIIQSARVYRPSWTHEDVTQEIAKYLLHLQKNTKSGWDPARGKWSTWASQAMIGWVSKLKRKAEDPLYDEASEEDV